MEGWKLGTFAQAYTLCYQPYFIAITVDSRYLDLAYLE